MPAEPSIKCKGECSKQEFDANNVKITKTSVDDVKCPKLTAAEEAAIANDIIASVKASGGPLTVCAGNKCDCRYDPPPPFFIPYIQFPFEWVFKKKFTPPVVPPAKPKEIKCKYTLDGTVDISWRIVKGSCGPKSGEGGFKITGKSGVE